MPKHFLQKKSTQKIMKATLSRLLSSKFEKSVIQPFTWYHSRFVPLSGTGNLPWPMDYNPQGNFQTSFFLGSGSDRWTQIHEEVWKLEKP